MKKQKSIEEQALTAADGRPVPGVCNTLGEWMRTIEEGAFDQDCYSAVRELSAKLDDHANVYGTAAGKLVISIDFSRDDSVTTLKADFKVTAPRAKRPRTILWTDEHNRFTPVRPNQHMLFGIRDAAGDSQNIRDAS